MVSPHVESSGEGCNFWLTSRMSRNVLVSFWYLGPIASGNCAVGVVKSNVPSSSKGNSIIGSSFAGLLLTLLLTPLNFQVLWWGRSSHWTSYGSRAWLANFGQSNSLNHGTKSHVISRFWWYNWPSASSSCSWLHTLRLVTTRKKVFSGNISEWLPEWSK